MERMPKCSAITAHVRRQSAASALKIVLLTAFLMAGWSDSAHTAPRQWLGGAGNWSTAVRWNPSGVPLSVDTAIIGQVNPVPGDEVLLDQNDIVAGVAVLNGMVLNVDDHTLTVNGDTLVSGMVIVPGDTTYRSELSVVADTGTAHFITDDLTLDDFGVLRMFGDAVVDVHGTLRIGESSRVTRNGEIRLFGSSGNTLVNDGVIEASSLPGGMEITQFGDGLIDLDGDDGDGQINANFFTLGIETQRSRLTVTGTQLADDFSSMMRLINGGRLNMNLSSGWTADSSSTIEIVSFDAFAPSEINGGDFLWDGRLDLGSAPLADDEFGWLEVNANVTFGDSFNADILFGGRLDTTGITTIDGGTFILTGSSEVNFNGPTTVRGGTFQTTSNSAQNGSVDFNGETDWRGNITVDGIARQLGNATVSTFSTITADRFDMDGPSGNTEWDINQLLTVNAERINSTTNTFNGTLNIGSGLFSSLNVNLLDPTNRTWTMAGTMNLQSGPFVTNRLSGAPVRITGDVFVSGRNSITANATFGGTSSLNISAASDVLRINGRASIEIGTDINGNGTLEIGTSGWLSIEPSISTGDVRVVNRGTFDLGLARGVVAVPDFENISGATLRADVGRNTLGTDSDILQVTDSAAVLDGFVQPNVVNIGGDFEPPEIGDSFTILTSINGLSGTFDGALDSLLGGLRLEWSVVHNPANVQVQLTDIGGLLGDYNGDGTVNAADYTVWRDTLGSTTNLAADGNLSGTIDPGDYTVWKSNFGATLGSGSGAVGSVPEPTSLVLGLMLAISCSGRLTAVLLRRRAK